MVRPCRPCNAAQCMLNSSCSAAPRYPAQPTATCDHAQRIDRIHRVVARVLIPVCRLLDEWIHAKKLACRWVVVAPYQIVRSCSCTVRPVVSGLSNPC